MTDSFWEFLQTDKVIALLAAMLIFFVTIFLVSKKWINFSITLLLLLFAIASGLAISNYDLFKNYYQNCQNISSQEQQAHFNTQMIQAVEDIKMEVHAEKENLRHLMHQVEEIFDQMDIQKRKLKNFIEETKENFKREKNNPVEPENPVP